MLFISAWIYILSKLGAWEQMPYFTVVHLFLDTLILLLVLLFNILHYLKLYYFLNLTAYLALYGVRRKRHAVCLGCHLSALFGAAESKLCWTGRGMARFQEEAEEASPILCITQLHLHQCSLWTSQKPWGKLSFSLQYRESHQKCGLYMQTACVQILSFAHIFLFLSYEGACARAGWQFFSRADFTYLFQFHIQWYPVSSLKLPIVRICNSHGNGQILQTRNTSLRLESQLISTQDITYYIKLPRRAQLNIQLDSFYLRIPHSQVKIRSITQKHSLMPHPVEAILTWCNYYFDFCDHLLVLPLLEICIRDH